MLKTHTHTQKQIKKTKLSLQLFLMANFDRVNGPIDMRVWKDADLRSGRRLETGRRSESIIYTLLMILWLNSQFVLFFHSSCRQNGCLQKVSMSLKNSTFKGFLPLTSFADFSNLEM